MKCVRHTRYLRLRWSTIARLLCLLSLAASGTTNPAGSSEAGVAPIGIGSMPGRLFEDGRVCIVEATDASRCANILFKLPDEILKRKVSMATSIAPEGGWQDNFFNAPEESMEANCAFDGIFDLDNDGSPEVFLECWAAEDPDCPEKYKSKEDACEAINWLVYKKVGATYQIYLKLRAQRLGCCPGAWFLSELPVRKAIFINAYHWMSGGELFYLHLKKRSLELISDGIPLREEPIFEDLDKDGVAEIFVKGRQWDRSSTWGAALLRWKDDTYTIWWPDWTSGKIIEPGFPAIKIPYVMDAALVHLINDQRKEIVAVLDPQGESHLRELGVWKLTKGAWSLVDKIKLPATRGEWRLAFPLIAKISPTADRTEIELDYSEGDRTLQCFYRKGKLTCADRKDQ